MKRKEKEDIFWNDKIAPIGLSSDSVPIVYSLPGLLLDPDQVGSTLYCCSFFPNDIYLGAFFPSPYTNGSKCKIDH